MPISALVLQRQLRELGRIRIGNQVPAGNGRTRPSKLDTFRITSKVREHVEAAAEAWGGTVVPWDNNGSAEFEVITESAVLDIIVPPGQSVSQWLELWGGGGCLRRCDGVTNFIDDTPCGSHPTKTPNGEIPACSLNQEERVEAAKRGQACKETTRLNVMLPQLPDLGVFRLESHGYYAAVELAGAAEILAMATATGRLIPARLRLDQREKKIPGKPTQKYAVPVIEFVDTKMTDLGLVLAGGSGPAQIGAGADAPRQIAAGPTSRPPLPPTEPPAESDFRAPGPKNVTPPAEATDEGLTQAAFRAALKDAGISEADALVYRRELFPEEDVPLTGADRQKLLDTLRERQAAAL